MTGSVDIEDLSPVTSPIVSSIPRTLVRAAVSGGIQLPTQNGAATVTVVQIGETFRAAFEITVATVATVVTIILIDRGGWCGFWCGFFASIRTYKIMILPFKYYGSVQILMGDPHICLQIRYQIFTSFINSHQLKACIQIIMTV